MYEYFELFFKSIILDFKIFNNVYKITSLIIFALISIVLSIIDLNYFINPTNYPNLLIWNNNIVFNNGSNGNSNNFNNDLWRRIINVLSGVASFTGVLCVVLSTFGKLSNYFWGIIHNIIYGLISYVYGYTGNAQLAIIFFLP